MPRSPARSSARPVPVGADYAPPTGVAEASTPFVVDVPAHLQEAWEPHRPSRPAKSEGGKRFELISSYAPAGDQPHAIADLVRSISSHEHDQVLLGVTGSGKTFTMAKIIEYTQRPALILAPNKTLAAQLYGEFKSFFPSNSVEYFVSYYDYYQPEAYVPRTDTFIEKDSSRNEQIDRMRHSATRAMLERDDVIVVASVSCIYGIGSVETYTAMTFTVAVGDQLDEGKLRPISSPCNTSATTPAWSAAPSAAAATPSRSSPPTTRIAPGASPSSATRSSQSRSSIP